MFYVAQQGFRRRKPRTGIMVRVKVKVSEEIAYMGIWPALSAQ